MTLRDRVVDEDRHIVFLEDEKKVLWKILCILAEAREKHEIRSKTYVDIAVPVAQKYSELLKVRGEHKK
jgi:hypothetical protein